MLILPTILQVCAAAGLYSPPVTQTSVTHRFMKAAVWILFALLSMLWTGTVMIFAKLTDWFAITMASNPAGDVINNAGQLPMPTWLSPWIDPTWIQDLQVTWVQILGWLGQSGPAIGGLVSWLIPLLWVVWGFVMLLMLASALAGHFLLGKFSRSASSPRIPA